MGNSDSLTDPMQFRSPLYLLVAALNSICKGLPCCSQWLPLRVTPATPGAHSSLYSSFHRDKCSSLPLLTTGSATPSTVTRLHLGSLSLQPAGLLDSLTEPLSRNLVLQVTPNTSFKLRGRTTQFPRSDFNRQVIRHTRHTVKSLILTNQRVDDLIS